MKQIWKLNMKSKLTLWAALLILLLFSSYNLLQYAVIQSWSLNQEKQMIYKKMDEVLAFLDEKKPTYENLLQSEDYLQKLNEKAQMIRVLKANGEVIYSLAEDVPEDMVAPKQVSATELTEIRQAEEHLLVLRSPLKLTGFTGTIEIIRNMETFEGLMKNIFTIMIIAGIGAILLSLIGGRILSHQLLKPIQAVVHTMKRIKKHGMTERVPIPPHHDEITELATVFNQLMDDLEKSFLRQKQFVEDASHELKTPLSVIHGHLSLINRWGKDDPEVLQKSLNMSLNEVNRLVRLVTELLELSRTDESANFEKEMVTDPKAVIEQVIQNFKLIYDDFHFHTDIKKIGRVQVSRRHLEQLIIIILDNAIKYATDKKEIETIAEDINQMFTLSIKDYGQGIPKEELPHVFNRFYRVDKARSRKSGGNGLGLAIANRIVEDYGGTMEIESEFGEWTKLTIKIPIN